jgi:hypothetical protein
LNESCQGDDQEHNDRFSLAGAEIAFGECIFKDVK